MATPEMDPHYSRALDEIWQLRAALAYEARVLAGHLDLKTFPKSRREFAERSIDRMHAAARGEALLAYRDIATDKKQWLLRGAGGSPTLTRGQWEAS